MIQIFHTSGERLYGLIYPEYLSILSISDQEIMKRSMNNSPDMWVVYDDNKVTAFAGVIPPTLLSDTAYLWLYTTKHWAAHRIACLRHSRGLIADALRMYPRLVGHCDVEAKASIRWTRWLGGQFSDPQGPIIPFRIEAH